MFPWLETALESITAGKRASIEKVIRAHKKSLGGIEN